MLRFLVRRLLLLVPLVWAVVSLIFVLVELAPGDSASKLVGPDTPPQVREMVVRKWGLDRPAAVRYRLMLRNLCLGELGRSIDAERPVSELVRERLPRTLLLGTTALGLGFLAGGIAGVVQATRRSGGAADGALTVVTLVLHSVPEFWLGLMLIVLFSLHLKWLPSTGMVDPVSHDFMPPLARALDLGAHLVLPALCLGSAHAAVVARYTRASMRESLRQDYVRTARAKGLPERAVVLRHALRTALIPVVTLCGLSLPALFSGAVVTETIFAWPGMGQLIVAAAINQDVPVLVGVFFVVALLVATGGLLADLAYARLDPRVRLT